LKRDSPAREPRDSGAAPTAVDAHAFHLPGDVAGERFDHALARSLPQFSRTRLKAWIEAGRVTLDGAIVAPDRTVNGGERVVVTPAADPRSTAHAAEAIALTIVHEDAAIIVIDKPAGLVVHPGSGNWQGTMMNALLHHEPSLAALPRAGIVHRLDKDTSGLMVVAKTLAAQTDLVRQLAAHTVKREYLAVANGDVARGGTVDAPVGRHPTRRTKMAVVATGKPARTHYSVVERFGVATFLRCVLETGRTHQIRVHLASLGHPLLGDPAYGKHSAVPFARQALHATMLSLVHPVTRQSCTWESAVPGDFASLLDSLRARAHAP